MSGTSPDPTVLARAAAVLDEGRLLVYPTDTLYAVGGRALDPDVGRAVRRAKGRDEGKPLPLIAAHRDQAVGLVRRWTAAAERLSEAFWPGPLSLVLEAAEHVPDAVTAGTGSVALRVPALALCRDLAERSGPLVSTSANLSGAPAPLTCAEAVASVGHACALALDAGPGRPASSTLVDLTGAAPELLRAGPVPWEAILRVLAAVS